MAVLDPSAGGGVVDIGVKEAIMAAGNNKV